MKSLTTRGILLASWMLFVAFLSLFPFQQSSANQWWQHTDKLVHFLMYFVLSVLVVSVLRIQKPYLSALIISGLFGIIIEVLQEIMRLGRSFSVMDIFANIMGIVLGLTSYYFMKKHI